MNDATTIAFLVAALASGVAFTASATEPPALAHNPFTRPPSERTIEQQAFTGDAQDAPTILELRATMVASNDSLANVGGRTLRPGDEVQGYRLQKVYEDRAVFVRDGRRLTVYVKPDLVEEDE